MMGMFLAPGDAETLRQLTDREARPRRQPGNELPQELWDFLKYLASEPYYLGLDSDDELKASKQNTMRLLLLVLARCRLWAIQAHTIFPPNFFPNDLLVRAFCK